MTILVECGCSGGDDDVGELEEKDGCHDAVEEETLGFQVEVGGGFLVDCY